MKKIQNNQKSKGKSIPAHGFWKSQEKNLRTKSLEAYTKFLWFTIIWYGFKNPLFFVISITASNLPIETAGTGSAARPLPLLALRSLLLPHSAPAHLTNKIIICFCCIFFIFLCDLYWYQSTLGYTILRRGSPYFLIALAQQAVLRNRNYLLRFRFRHLTSYGSGSGSGSVSRP